MKRTTYILIGMLISLLVLMVGGTLYISTQGTDTDIYMLPVSDKIEKSEFPGIRAVKLYTDDSRSIGLHGAHLNVVPASDGKVRLSYPESDYLKVSRDADTLVICLDLSNYDFPGRKKDYILPTLQVEGLQLTLETGAGLTFLSNRIGGMNTKIRGMQADSLTTYSIGGEMCLDSCHIRALNVDGWAIAFNANQSAIRHLYLDLDGVHKWTVDQCAIDTEHLTGSGNHRNQLQKGECRQVVWTPKEEDASLSVVLSEKSTFMLQPE